MTSRKTTGEAGSDHRFSGPIADDYDATFRLICPHLDELEQSVGNALLRLKDGVLTRPLKILDLGCGDGLTSKVLLETLGSIELVALDNEPKMLEQAKQQLRGSPGARSVIYEEADALEFLRRVQDGAFDGIGSCFVLHNFEDEYRREVLREIFRVLVPGGLFANADKVAEPQPQHGRIFLKQLTVIIDTYLGSGRPDLMREWVLHYLEDNIPGRLWIEADAIGDLGDAGFKEIEKTFRYDLEATLVARKPFDGE